jgi:hypothetical protein
LAEQDFALQELKLEETVRTGEFTAELDTFFGVFQSPDKITAPLCLVGNAVKALRRLPAKEPAARRQANGQEEPRRS